MLCDLWTPKKEVCLQVPLPPSLCLQEDVIRIKKNRGRGGAGVERRRDRERERAFLLIPFSLLLVSKMQVVSGGQSLWIYSLLFYSLQLCGEYHTRAVRKHISFVCVVSEQKKKI